MKRILLMIAALAILAQGCDEMDRDVIPSEDKIDAAANIQTTLTPNSPVIINLVQGSKFTGDATIKIVTEPQHGTISILGLGLIQYLPNQDFTTGVDRATYSVCSNGQCDEGDLEFTFSSEGICKIAALYDHASVSVGTAQVVLHILDNDIACDTQFDVSTLSIVEQPPHGEAVATDGIIFYYPESNFSRTTRLIYSIATRNSPDYKYYGIAEVSIQPNQFIVDAVNDNFTYTLASYQAALNPSYHSLDFPYQDIIGNDETGNIAYNQLQISITAQPAHGQVTYYAGEMFRYIPGNDFSGSDSFTYQICYGGTCSQATVSITVSDWSSVLTATNDTFYYTRAEYETLISTGFKTLDFLYSEVIGNDQIGALQPNQLTVSVVSQPAHAALTYYSFEMFRYAPNASFNGQDEFTYKICHNDQCSEAVVAIVVTDW